MTKPTTIYGTCPACFRAFVVLNGKIRKHGWTEQGGRQVGSYGNAWHTGECFGVGYEPFELSTEGTVAFVSYLGKMLAGAQERLDAVTIATEFVYEGVVSFGQYHYGVGREKAPFAAKIKEGDERAEKLYFGPRKLDTKYGFMTIDGAYQHHLACDSFYVPSFGDHKKSVVSRAAGIVAAIEEDMRICNVMLAHWKLRPLMTKKIQQRALYAAAANA